jgi:RNA polymerase-binding protein DksA
MAGTTRKSLAGSAAAAAKRMSGRKSAATSAPDAPAKKAPARKAPAKKAPAKKATVTKASATKAAPAHKAPAKKAPATKSAAAEKAPAKKAPARKAAPAKKAPAKKAPAGKAAPATKTTTVPARKATSVTNSAPAKKAAPRKAAPARLVVLEGEDAWTRGELNEVVKELQKHRERLTTWVNEAEEELARLMRDAGDGAGHDQADVGATSFERDHELTVLARERETLGQLDRALAHIDDGTYGVCDSCGNPIGKNRLIAVPHATLCMSCKQREERR